MRSVKLFALVAATTTAVACAPPSSDRVDGDPPATAGSATSVEVCTGGRQRCLARMQLAAPNAVPLDAPPGYGPSDLQSAYHLDVSTAVTATMAVVEAYDYANLESDLAAYRAQYGIPPCTSASGCLQILNQNGQASPLPGGAPAGDDWTVETALDVDMASAMCPSCKIIVMQADDDVGSGLFVANATAASLGATVISNSWGGDEGQYGSDLAALEADLDHPGVAVFASTGDNGYDDGGGGALYPSTSAYTIAVGGTTLEPDATTVRGWSEVAWGGGGASCSGLVPAPAWQHTPCPKRAAADIAAIGDPETGVAVYHASAGTFINRPSPWIVLGGTSVSSPLVAAMFAQTGNGAKTAEYTYGVPFYEVTAGNDGSCGNALCVAGPGWNGPTGNGTPNGAVLTGAVAPTVTIETPYPGQPVPDGFSIEATCDAGGGPAVVGVDIAVNSESVASLKASPYITTAPLGISDGELVVTARCTNAAGVQATKAVLVFQSAACNADSDCNDDEEICYLHACIAGPSAAGGLGTKCKDDGACSSKTCVSDGGDARCALACEKSLGCPGGFECLTTGGSGSGSGSDVVGECWPDGGCNAGGEGGGFGAMVVLLAGVLATRRRGARAKGD